MYGWIKLHRKLQNKGYYKNSKFVHLWIHLLLKANHEAKEFMWNNTIIVIKEGQFITGRKQLSQETGISETSIERILKTLENEQQIGQQTTTKYRLITILNWKEYQIDGQQNGQQADSKRTTSGHKQELKELEERKEELLIEHPLQKFIRENLPNISKLKIQLTNEDCERLLTDFPKEVIRDVLEAMENNKELNKKYLSVNLTIRNWAKRRLVNGADKQGTPKRRGEFDAEKFAELLNSKPEV